MPTRPTLPARGRYTMTRLRPTGTTTAPALPTRFTTDPDGDPDFQAGWACDWTAAGGDGCPAPAPLTCEGTDWPPMTSWQRYAEDRRQGQRVPPSVSTWREQDRKRQAEAEREIRSGRCVECGQPPTREHRGVMQCACGTTVARPMVAVPWGPGPSCEGKAGR